MTMNRRMHFASSCARERPDQLSAFESQGWVTIKDALGDLFKNMKASVYSSIQAPTHANAGTEALLTPPQRCPNISPDPLPI